jgi:nucleoside-diphosphate-sugar epimerase
MADCDTVMHLAVATAASSPDNANLLGENLKGLLNLLQTAESRSIKKMLFMSSVDALGIFKGEAPPLYFPIDDEHPCAPSTEYGIGKLLGERMCALWSERTGISSIALRPPGIWFPETYGLIEKRRKENPSYEWDPYWEYGAFIDVEDLLEVSLKAAGKRLPGTNATYLVAAADITTSGKSSLELATMIHPKVAWKDMDAYKTDPFRSLLIAGGDGRPRLDARAPGRGGLKRPASGARVWAGDSINGIGGHVLIEKTAYYLGRNDEGPNVLLAEELADRNDAAGIAEIAKGLEAAEPQVAGDCVKVLYEVGYRKPD